MNSRYRIYLGVIGALAVVNIGRWVFAGGQTEPAASERVLLADDFRLRVDVPGASERGRDLFSANGGARGVLAPVKHRLRPKPTSLVAPVAASSPAASQVMAASGLGKLRLLGVVFHGGRRQAYLALDKENCIASMGDTVFGQFTVDAINVDVVDLRDLKTNMTRRIPVTGK